MIIKTPEQIAQWIKEDREKALQYKLDYLTRLAKRARNLRQTETKRVMSIVDCYRSN